MTRLQRKAELISELAIFLAEDVGRKSIELQMGKPDAQAWSHLRNAAGVQGHMTLLETVELLNELL